MSSFIGLLLTLKVAKIWVYVLNEATRASIARR
jgi:hypothetical protein